MKVRIKFTKHGPVKYIGHLDIMRYFQKAIRRAKLDIAYSEGYSPHQIMSFAQPLGVGLESNGEYMDVEMVSHTTADDMIHKLNMTMAEGITISSMVLLPETTGNAMATVAAAKYSIYFKKAYKVTFDLTTAVEAFMKMDQLLVTKKTKKSEAQLDLKPAIYEFSVKSPEQEVLEQDLALHSEIPALSLLVDASSSGNIKPVLVLEALFLQNNCVLEPFSYQIIREETYAKEDDNLVPMDSLGEKF